LPPEADRRRAVIVGTGRAGGSFTVALGSAGWSTEAVVSRTVDEDDVEILRSADLVMIAVSDSAIADVARRIADVVGPCPGVVAHVSGASDLDVVSPHARVGSIHPLMSLPDSTTGARRLLDNCWFAVDGDPMMDEVVDSLGGHAVHVAGERRAAYHATASVAANHLVALCAHVERLATAAGVPAEAYWNLASTTLDNVIKTGASAALTGPAARGDWDTIRQHLAAIPEGERDLYLALGERAAAVAGRVLPAHLSPRSG
jgi:predicted short-subunit dehydrogenase-like oxidoreductase (DUF2520 family)